MNKETREGDYTQGIAALSYYLIRVLTKLPNGSIITN